MTDVAAIDAAEHRVADFWMTFERLGVEDFRTTALSLEADGLDAARESAAERAVEAGLDELVRDERLAVREQVMRTFAIDQYRPTIIGPNWGLSDGPTRDRVAAAQAAEDAVMAAILESFLDDAAQATLRARYDLIDPGRADDADDDPPGNGLGASDGRWTVVAVAGLTTVLIAALVTGWWILVVAGATVVILDRRRRSAAARARAEGHTGT